MKSNKNVFAHSKVLPLLVCKSDLTKFNAEVSSQYIIYNRVNNYNSEDLKS